MGCFLCALPGMVRDPTERQNAIPPPVSETKPPGGMVPATTGVATVEKTETRQNNPDGTVTITTTTTTTNPDGSKVVTEETTVEQ